MDPLRLDAKDPLAPAWAGLGEVAQMPVRVATTGSREAAAPCDILKPGAPDSRSADGSRANDAPEPPRPWWRSLLRVARDATIGLALITAVPVVVVAVRGVPAQQDVRDLQARLSDVDPVRPYALPISPSVTPAEAGAALQRVHEQLRATTGSLFPESDANAGTASLDGRNMAHLRAVAEHPIWRDVDLVASAEAVDVVGGAYTLPFAANLTTRDMVIPPFSRLKELTQAGWLRAEYYLVTGAPERAVAAAQATLGLGLVYIDDGTNTISALIGRIIVGEGSDALQQIFHAAGDARGDDMPSVQRANTPRTILPSATERAAYAELVVQHAGDPALPRSVRWEQVLQQSLTTCESTRTMLLPNSSALQAMYARTRAELARFPSELAYVDLIERSASSLPAAYPAASTLGDRIVMGAATVAGTVLQNPRIATCTRLALDNER